LRQIGQVETADVHERRASATCVAVAIGIAADAEAVNADVQCVLAARI
jgi:hypothetical protein